MVLSDANGWCFPAIPWTTVHPEIWKLKGLKKRKTSCGWGCGYLFKSNQSGGSLFYLLHVLRLWALGCWKQTWAYRAGCISWFSFWFLRDAESLCWGRCLKCCVRQNLVSPPMPFRYGCLEFPAVLMVLAAVALSLDLCLIALWCRNVCVSLSTLETSLLWLSV